MKNYNIASIAIVRTKGWGTCKGCRYTVGTRNPRGELAFQVEGGGKAPRFYHFGCHSKAVEDYEASMDHHLTLLHRKEETVK